MDVVALKGFQGYWITEEGDVFSTRSNSGKGSKPMKKLKEDWTTGYARVTMSVDGRTTRKQVHRLVAMNFIGDPPEGKHLVRHLDGDPKNNNLRNLAWGDFVDNEADKMRHGRAIKGELNHFSKINHGIADEIRKDLLSGMRSSDVSKKHSVSSDTVTAINLNKRWCDDSWTPINLRAGERHPKSKLCWDDVFKIRKRLKDGIGVCEVAKSFDMPSSAISAIKANRSWVE